MMEYCESEMDYDLILLIVADIHTKTDTIPPNPVFQHSTIPTCPAEVTTMCNEGGYPVAFDHRKFSHLSMIGPEGR